MEEDSFDEDFGSGSSDEENEEEETETDDMMGRRRGKNSKGKAKRSIKKSYKAKEKVNFRRTKKSKLVCFN